jgi:two-component system LytT family sensor kinase
VTTWTATTNEVDAVKEEYDLSRNRVFTYLLRIFILYLFSVIFKSFDLTFIHQMGVFEWRGQLFSICYVVFGLIVWEGAIWLSRYIEKKVGHNNIVNRIFVLSLCIVIYGLLVSFLFGFFYAVMGMDQFY